MMLLLGIETAVTAILLALAFAAPRLGSRWFRALECYFGSLARRKGWSVVVVGASALSARLLLLPVLPIPEPMVHDEFSHLLAAQTFASGRLTNPTHPMWVHFESFHIDHRPTYTTMFFPGQGLALGAGKVIFGHPWFGVWISVGLMCSAICWMLQGWLPPGWALLGGMLVVIRLGTFSYWMNSYWGGALAAMGGALVLGALPRLRRRPRVQTTLLLGLGVVTLANTRSYEGLLLCFPVVVALFAGWRKTRLPSALWLKNVAVPAGLILLAAAGALGSYDWRVFGSPSTLPYRVNRETYAVAPHFIWQAAKPEPVYHHKVLRDFYVGWELAEYKQARTFKGLVRRTMQKLSTVLSFYFGPVLALPLIMLPRVLRDRRTRFLVLTGAVITAGLLAEVWLLPHYVAPATCLLYAILLQSMRHLRAWRPEGRPTGLFWVRMIPLICVAMMGVRLFAEPPRPPAGRWLPAWYTLNPGNLERSRVLARLERTEGRHLVIVRYATDHNPFDEWVYNEADIDASKVVWAREMDAQKDRELLLYFHDRAVWLVTPDSQPVHPMPYNAAAECARP